MLPVYFANVDPWSGETASDNRYACVDGNDALPDLLIGRLPVTSESDAESMVAKILTYETDPWPGEWIDTVLLVADDRDEAGSGSCTGTRSYSRHPVVTRIRRKLRSGCSVRCLGVSDLGNPIEPTPFPRPLAHQQKPPGSLKGAQGRGHIVVRRVSGATQCYGSVGTTPGL